MTVPGSSCPTHGLFSVRPFCRQAQQNNAGYISYPNYERDYAPSPVLASYADPRLSARYGNPHLRANSLTNLPPPAGYSARRAAAAAQHVTAAGQPPPGRLATHV